MSKQYLNSKTITDAHATDIFTLAVTRSHILSASGASSIKVYDTTDSEYPLSRTLTGAHPLGCHHIVTSRNGNRAVSAGFGGEAKIWDYGESEGWVSAGDIVDGNKVGEIWAIALSEDGLTLASTSYDGRINVWDLTNGHKKIREYETKGSFGLCIDMSRDGKLIASGHENGAIYLFSIETGRMLHSLPGLVKPVRAVAFNPAATFLAASGDARIIALYDVNFGEQFASLTGHSTWVFSLDWNEKGENILSSSFDGKVKVWSVNLRMCVATHGEADKTLWCAKWLPFVEKNERFVTAGSSRSITIYREATGC
ncbi:unnamed protein product [Blumeria hordei]|uniref:Uncharacterized protein n=2 Tax=Blumeria hordei TaxID=2867405 RepID=A0A383V1T1_BLUHO|nr:meiotic recombination protein Ski8/Rec14 [Blumeria hordei DH14]SZF05818.1 unnamed protein product [Blumeria hordei]